MEILKQYTYDQCNETDTKTKALGTLRTNYCLVKNASPAGSNEDASYNLFSFKSVEDLLWDCTNTSPPLFSTLLCSLPTQSLKLRTVASAKKNKSV